MNPDLIELVLHFFSFMVSLQGKIGETGETGPKGFPVSSYSRNNIHTLLRRLKSTPKQQAYWNLLNACAKHYFSALSKQPILLH